MADLRALCEAADFLDVRKYIPNGNVVLRSAFSAKQLQSELEAALAEYGCKPSGARLRSSVEIAAVLAGNPFPEAITTQQEPLP